MRRRWWNVRTRLTLVYGALFLLSGIILLAINYALVDRATSAQTVTVVFPDGGSASTTINLGADEEEPHTRVTGNRQSGEPLPAAPDPEQMRELAVEQHSAQMRTLLTQSGIALTAMTIVSVAFGWVMANRALRPLRTITATTRRITEHNLDERLSLGGPDDELKELGDTIDDLLTRLDGSFQAQRRFVANASHELRTPLARQRAIAQVALDDPDASADALRSAHERVLAAGAQEERLVDTLLTLAQGQNGVAERELLDLAGLAEDAVAVATHDAERAQVSVAVTLDSAATQGDARLVERLIANLIDNAIRHNYPTGSVDVATFVRDHRAVLRVQNSGPDVPPHEVDRLFEPFRRLDLGRTHDSGGYGLGLSIVRAVADAHGAAVTAVARVDGGLAVEVSFPAVPPAMRGLLHG